MVGGSLREFGSLHYFISNFCAFYRIDRVGGVGRRGDGSNPSRRGLKWGDFGRKAEGRGDKVGQRAGRLLASLFGDTSWE